MSTNQVLRMGVPIGLHPCYININLNNISAQNRFCGDILREHVLWRHVGCST